MKYKYLIKKLMSHSPSYDASNQEHKPIADKIKEMGKPDNYLHDMIIRNRRSFRAKRGQYPDEPIFDIIYWCLDFDVTEEYVWYRAAKNMDSDGFKEFCKRLAGI